MATSEWRPIETAPKDGVPILAWAPGWDTPDVVWWQRADHLGLSDGWYDGMTDNFGDPCGPVEPTHWVPLPDLPAMIARAQREGVEDA
jgi:hypothetical protein